jgi:hypothetical protein
MAAMQEREKELQLVQSVCQGLLSVNSRPDFCGLHRQTCKSTLAIAKWLFV